MADNKWNMKYEQLNQRSRWYSSQLWYIPFAYVGIVGIGLEKMLKLPYPLNSLGLILLGIFSISVFVHVSTIKFYERRAVRSMQNMEKEEEGKSISGGGSPWYLSFAWYIKLMICIASYIFIAYGIFLVKMRQCERRLILVIILLDLTIFYIFIVWKDHVRNRDLRKKISEDTYYWWLWKI